jgi:hypothetical protein
MPLDVHGKEPADLSIADVRKWSRYLRMTYGAGAIAEAERRVAAYGKDSRHEIADIWKLVLMHLRGCEVTDETHRILRIKRKLRIKSA